MDEAALRLVLRATARVSLIFFVCAFAGRGARILWPSAVTSWLDRSRSRFILAFAASHTLHLAAILGLASVLGRRFIQEFTWMGLILGGLVYVLIYCLAAAVLLPDRRLFSTRFQSVALYVIWFVFALAFVAGTVVHSWFYLPLAFLTIAALVIRILGNRQGTTRSAASIAAG